MRTRPIKYKPRTSNGNLTYTYNEPSTYPKI